MPPAANPALNSENGKRLFSDETAAFWETSPSMTFPWVDNPAVPEATFVIAKRFTAEEVAARWLCHKPQLPRVEGQPGYLARNSRTASLGFPGAMPLDLSAMSSPLAYSVSGGVGPHCHSVGGHLVLTTRMTACGCQRCHEPSETAKTQRKQEREGARNLLGEMVPGTFLWVRTQPRGTAEFSRCTGALTNFGLRGEHALGSSPLLASGWQLKYGEVCRYNASAWGN